MSGKTAGFTGESYEPDGNGGFLLRKRIALEKIPSRGTDCRFQVTGQEKKLTDEEQLCRDRARLKRAGRELSGIL